MAAQLGPLITERCGTPAARRIAIAIARTCACRGLEGPLTDRVLDRDEELTVRVEAGAAVWELGDEDTRRRLTPLLATDLDEDVEDELKGYVLKSLWPGLISAEEVLRVITPRKRGIIFGSYASFLTDDLSRGLAREDVPLALGWAARQGDPERTTHILDLVIDQIMLRAWDELETPGIAEALAGVVWKRIESLTEVINSLTWRTGATSFGADVVRRRRLVQALLRVMKGRITQPAILCHSRPPMIMVEDLSWLIGLLDTEHDAEIRPVVARLVRFVFLLPGPRSPDEVLAAAAAPRVSLRQ